MTCDRCFDGRHVRCRKNGCTCTVCKEMFSGVSRSSEPPALPAKPGRTVMGPGRTKMTDGQRRVADRARKKKSYAAKKKDKQKEKDDAS